MIRIPLLAALLLLLAVPAVAGAPTPAAFDRFVRETGPACALKASSACFERIFRFADRDRDGALDLAELEGLQTRGREWLLGHSRELPPADKQAAVLTLLAIDFVGLDHLFASYDADGDGLLTREEVSADLTLDERPVPVLVEDPDAVDWDRLMERLGTGAAVLKDVLPRRSTS
ncbi:MAG TPA: hypothetical protein VNS22_15325 [Geminicoccus sp.]|uniref:hypothetical protein n=1 Tax=Geminicoccus sp. TaxID=2024832 RepID=UPI002B51D18B|nr:hypothetical protein [Geminicoccus sp.]HWL69739.1 hypothetical protein [Geminicoccus sp.]